MATDPRLELLVRQVQELPVLPDVAIKTVQMIDNSRVSAADVGKTLSADPGMTARVLKLANSAFYGASRRISTVTEAVVMLGMRTVRNMAMAISCQDMLQKELPGYSLRRGDLWRHSFCCALASQSLAKRAGYRVVEEAFVAGLLHDIGKVIVNLHLRQQFDEVLKRAVDGHLPFMDAERDVLGFDHATVGARILEKWNFPVSLVESVRYHHDPRAQGVVAPLTGIVHAADAVCITLGIGIGSDGLAYTLQTDVLDMLKLTETDFEEVLGEISEKASRIDSLG